MSESLLQMSGYVECGYCGILSGPGHDAICRRKLRDRFAGEALHGILANPDILAKYGLVAADVAKDAYNYADAMLEARSK